MLLASSAEIEMKSEILGMPLRRTDVMVAAIMLNREAALYTFDLRHFEPIKAFGLKLFL